MPRKACRTARRVVTLVAAVGVGDEESLVGLPARRCVVVATALPSSHAHAAGFVYVVVRGGRVQRIGGLPPVAWAHIFLCGDDAAPRPTGPAGLSVVEGVE
jgi:hypothetical protein